MSPFDGLLKEAESRVAPPLVVIKVSFLTKEGLGKSLALDSTRVHGALRTGDIRAAGDRTQSCAADGVADIGIIADEGSCAARALIGRIRRVDGCLVLGNVVDRDIHGESGLLHHVQLPWDKSLLGTNHVRSLLSPF